MSSSKPDSTRGRMLAFNRATLHPLIAIAVPALFVCTLTAFLPLFFGAGVRIPILFYVLLFVAGLEETVVGNILFKERTSSFVRFRELIYLCIGAALLLFVVQRGSPAARLAALGQVRNVVSFLAVPVQWLLSWYIHSALREREFLLQSTGEKEGAELKAALRENAEQAKEALDALRKARFLIGFFQTVVFVLLIVAFILQKAVAGGLLAVAVLHAVSGLVFLVVLNNAREDQLLYGDGVNVGFREQRRRFLIVAVILLLVFLLVVFFARSSSVLSLSLFEGLLNWLSNLFNREREAPEPPPIQPQRPELQEGMREVLQELGEQEQSPWLQTLFRILGRLLLGAAAAAVVYFLLSPLLSRYFRRRVGALLPLQAILRRLKGFLSTVKSLMNDLRSWFRQSKSYSAARRRVAAGERRWRRARERQPGWLKRIEMGRILRAYLKLIKWGKRRGVPYRGYMAPQEYGRELAEEVPAVEEALGEAVDIMEEALFSPDLVERGKVSRYMSLMKSIVKERA